MTTSTTRRTLLRAAPALLAPGLLASGALAQGVTVTGIPSADTPLLALFREWDDLMARWNGAPDEDAIALAADADKLQTRIAAEPITCLADLAAKVVSLSCYGDEGLPDSVTAEAEAILAEGLA